MTDREKNESDKAIRDFVYENNEHHTTINGGSLTFEKTVEVFDKNNKSISIFDSEITIKDDISSEKSYIIIENDKIKETTDKAIYWPTTNKCINKKDVLIIQNDNNTIIIS